MKLITLALLLFGFFKTSFTQNFYPGQGLIGKGYNVFGEFANNKSVQRYKLFDFSKVSTIENDLGQKTPELVYVESFSEHLIKTIDGSSISEYSNKFSQDFGLGAQAFFFKASFDVQFKNASQQTESLFYYTYMDINTKWRVSLDMRNMEKIISCLDQQFKTDLETMEPKKLFELYGTHFVSSAYLGGRVDYSTTSQLTEDISMAELKGALSAKYGAINGYFSENNYYDNVLNETHTETVLTVVGGNAEYTNSISNKDQYKKWVEGIEKNSVLCGFDNNSLLPIWSLTLNETRKKELENYFNLSILPLYPLPSTVKNDLTLESKEFIEKFNVYLKGFYVVQDCDYYLLTGDEAGDFRCKIQVNSNGENVYEYVTEAGKVQEVWSGEWLNINKTTKLEIPLNSANGIEVKATLVEFDDLQEENLGSRSHNHLFPFSTNDLYNTVLDGMNYYRIDFNNADDCKVVLFYHISPFEDKTAIDYGSKGWEEFLNGNYEKAQYYNREALKLTNTLWFVQYNVALIYLIQNNPLALEKYKAITDNCPNTEMYKAALKDILDYEKKHGQLNHSEQVKILLQSKMQ